MARKPMTEEQKEVARQNMAKARAARQEKLAQREVSEGNSTLEAQVQALIGEVERLKRLNADNPITPEEKLNLVGGMQGVDMKATVGKDGIQGIQYKYPSEKSFYPDPTDRLYDDPALRRYAMRENYIIKWDVQGTIYEKHGITYSEPTFIVELFHKYFDPDTNEWDGKRMIFVNRQMQHEDELYARMAADKLGMYFENLEDLMNEMRYQRIRDWLLKVFTPITVSQHQKQQRTMVIDGKVVEMYDTEEVTSKGAGADTAEAIRRETRLD